MLLFKCIDFILYTLYTITALHDVISFAIQIFHAEEGTPEEDELALVLVKDYEDKNIGLPKLDPVEAVKLKMEERGIKAKDLEPLPGSKEHISSVLLGEGN